MIQISMKILLHFVVSVIIELSSHWFSMSYIFWHPISKHSGPTPLILFKTSLLSILFPVSSSCLGPLVSVFLEISIVEFVLAGILPIHWACLYQISCFIFISSIMWGSHYVSNSDIWYPFNFHLLTPHRQKSISVIFSNLSNLSLICHTSCPYVIMLFMIALYKFLAVFDTLQPHRMPLIALIAACPWLSLLSSYKKDDM